MSNTIHNNKVAVEPGGTARFVRQIVITPGTFCSGGGSRSLIVTRKGLYMQRRDFLISLLPEVEVCAILSQLLGTPVETACGEKSRVIEPALPA